jgi:hypothetical protein
MMIMAADKYYIHQIIKRIQRIYDDITETRNTI